jgi:hypothetical protein
MKILSIVLLGLMMIGCTKFEASIPSQDIYVSQSGGFLLSRDENFRITHQWLDAETNTLHEISIERNLSENADHQKKLLETAFNLGLKAGTGN